VKSSGMVGTNAPTTTETSTTAQPAKAPTTKGRLIAAACVSQSKALHQCGPRSPAIEQGARLDPAPATAAHTTSRWFRRGAAMTLSGGRRRHHDHTTYARGRATTPARPSDAATVALFDAIATEHATIYGYGMVVGRTDAQTSRT